MTLRQRTLPGLAVALVLGVVAWYLTNGLQPAARAVTGITIFIGILWLTESLPLWTSALLVPPLLTIFADVSVETAFAPFFDPVIALLLGGLILGEGIHQYGLDIKIASFFIDHAGETPARFLLGMMTATAFLSFWISNTAAAALLMPVGLRTLTASGIEKGSSYAKATVLGIGYAATIGGIGTLVGTPPNLIAVNNLASAGIDVTFLGWMLHAAPLVAMMIPLTWFVLSRIYPADRSTITLPELDMEHETRHQRAIIATTLITAVLWLTTPLHGIDSAVIAMLPIIVFFGTGLLEKEALNNISWDILLLIGGGLALGQGLVTTGLDTLIADALAVHLQGIQPFLLLFLLGIAGIGLTAVIANTGAAALLIPVMLPLSQQLGIPQQSMAMLIGIVVSFDLIVPVGTPPNALAYGTGHIHVRDMVIAGTFLSIIGALLVAATAVFVW